MILFPVFIILACVCCFSIASPLHIVVAIADDLGWSDVGYNNLSGIRTPHIDELARRGIILTNHYVQPLCSPSRASLLTGRYPIHLGDGLNENVFSPDEDVGLSLRQELLSEKLKELGYRTALFGKWHLGHSRVAFLPTRRGFDRFYGFYTGAIDYYSHNQTASRCQIGEKRATFLDFRDQDKIVRDRIGEYSPAIFNEKAIEFIKKHDKKSPMFLVMSYQNVHDPLQVPKKYSSMYNDIGDKDRQIYAGMTSYLDDSVRMLTGALKSKGMWDNTVFVFMSDNGGNPFYAGYNWPLRGAKGTVWEGGIRAVSFLSGGFLKNSGFKSNALVHVSDWFPTLLNLARKQTSPLKRKLMQRRKRGQRKPRNDKEASNEIGLDGIDVWEAVTLRHRQSPRKYILHNINNQSFAIRKGNWKLISELDMGWSVPPERTPASTINTTGRPLDPKTFKGYLLDPKLPRIRKGLYNLKHDRSERHDLSDQHSNVVKELFGIVERYRRTMVSHDRKYECNNKVVEKASNKNAWGPLSD